MVTLEHSCTLLRNAVVALIFLSNSLSSAQRTPRENLVLADCGIGLGPNGDSTSREILYYPADVWTGQKLDTYKPSMVVNVPWSGSYPWGQPGGVSATMPNGDVLTIHINPSIRDPEPAGDAWHKFEMDIPLKCYSYHWDKVYQLTDGKWCSSAYVCNHLGKPYLDPQDGNSYGDWVDPAKAHCSDPLMADRSADAMARWKASGANWAFATATLDWAAANSSANDHPTSLTFSNYVADRLGAREMFECADVDSKFCTTPIECDRVHQPAGMLILNSFIALNAMQSQIHAGLEDAMNIMQNFVGDFQDIFSPGREPPKKTWLSNLVDTLQLVAGVASGFSWNIAASGTKLFTQKDRWGFYKDSVNSAVGYGFQMYRHHQPTPADVQNGLSSAMGTVFRSLIDAQSEFLEKLFSGTGESIGLLQKLTKNGLALQLAEKINKAKYSAEAQKLVYAQLLPLAWKHSTTEIKGVPHAIRPMILMSPGCIKSGPNLNWVVDSNKSERMAVCYKGHTFFVGFPTFKEVEHGTPHGLKLWALPGGEHSILNGTSQAWGGLTLDDLVISAFEGYRRNNYKNGFDASKDDGSTAPGDIIMGNGVLTPGFVKLPICTVEKLWEETKILYHVSSDLDHNTFPCGNGNLTATEMAQFGFS
ncbi:hypothetical protein JX265_010468 [Neoarthrinium moseri]|uniref:Uncharacterized protein n=1 Tax=Neoarthrinium moseri TaxID=1658444 RepID=A0A9P9WED1_9PEZI|nr:hypothetical protein JX265_010468 [Neoarthrinium moseri]